MRLIKGLSIAIAAVTYAAVIVASMALPVVAVLYLIRHC